MARERKGGGCSGFIGGILMLGIMIYFAVNWMANGEDADQGNEVTEVEEVTAEEVVEEETETMEDRIVASFDHTVIDGVDTYTYVKESSWSANMLMNHFNSDSTRLLKIVHDDITNGAVFRLATTMVDEYGNEKRQIVASMWYTQSTIEQINYDNWPRLDRSGLYDTADAVVLHSGLARDIDENFKHNENLPSFVRDTLYMEY